MLLLKEKSVIGKQTRGRLLGPFFLEDVFTEGCFHCVMTNCTWTNLLSSTVQCRAVVQFFLSVTMIKHAWTVHTCTVLADRCCGKSTRLR